MATIDEIKARAEECMGRDECLFCSWFRDVWCDRKTFARETLETIKRLEATQPKWISVEERLPEPYRAYLVVLKEKYAWEAEWRYHVDVADLQDDGGYIENRWNTFNDWYEGQEIHVTHWMPLPVPPEVE